jgi:acetylornithine deacetylase/succinyl-diaminopimelate desuccinylase-like protein
VDGNQFTRTLCNVHYVPNADYQLLSEVAAYDVGPITPMTAGKGRYVSVYTDEATGYVDVRIQPNKTSERSLQHFK